MNPSQMKGLTHAKNNCCIGDDWYNWNGKRKSAPDSKTNSTTSSSNGYYSRTQDRRCAVCICGHYCGCYYLSHYANKMRFRSCMCKILTYNVNTPSQESPDVKSRGLFIRNLTAQTIYLCVPINVPVAFQKRILM